MFETNDRVRFKPGLFTQAIGDVTYTVTGVYRKGEPLPDGETYNGPDELYRIETDEPSVPKPLRILYEKENSLQPAS